MYQVETMFYQSWAGSWDKKEKEEKDRIQAMIIVKELKSCFLMLVSWNEVS